MVDAVVCRALRVVRGGNEVLRGIDLTVRAGEVTGLLGPSGGGKTTLMRSLVGTQLVRRVLGASAFNFGGFSGGGGGGGSW